MADVITFTTTCQGEMPGYPIGEWREGHFNGIRKLLVGWNDRDDLLAELDTAAKGYWPYADGPTSALCRRVKIAPLGDEEAGQVNAAGLNETEYEFAVITAWYSTKGPVWYDSNLYNEYIQSSKEFATVNPTGLLWDDGEALTTDNAFGKIHSGCVLVREWPRVEIIPAWVLGNIDCVNDALYTSPLLGIGFAAERLLYTTPTISAEVTLGKLTRYHVTTRCLYRPVSWNYQWRAATHQWEAVYLSDGTTPYKQYTPVTF